MAHTREKRRELSGEGRLEEVWAGVAATRRGKWPGVPALRGLKGEPLPPHPSGGTAPKLALQHCFPEV